MNPMNADMNESWCPSTNPHHQHKLYEALKINKESRIIKKPYSTTTSSTTLSHGFRASTNTNSPPPKPRQRHPLIIYTQSPKIIHTNLKDFKALVQKLTGMSHSEDDQKSDPHGIKHDKNKGCKMVDVSGANQDENESFIDITTREDICGSVEGKTSMEGNAPENSNFIGNMDIPHHNGANNYNELQCYSSEPSYHSIDFNIPFN